MAAGPEKRQAHTAWPYSDKLLEALKGGAPAPSEGGAARPRCTADPFSSAIETLAEERKIPRPNPSDEGAGRDPTEQAVLALFEKGSWVAVLNDVTLPYLTAHGQGPEVPGSSAGDAVHTHATLRMWLYRAIALWKLRRFSVIDTELKSFGGFDRPEFCYESYPDVYPGKKGSMVPFSLRLLWAELPAHLGKLSVALDQLCELKRVCQMAAARLKAGLNEDGSEFDSDADSGVAIECWAVRLRRITFGIGNCLISQKEYELAIEVLLEVRCDDDGRNAVLYSGLGRIALLQGDSERAAHFFSLASDSETASGKIFNDGFMHLTSGKYAEAAAAFGQAWELNHDSTAAGNNQAVCQLYMGELSTAVDKLREVHKSNVLHENLVFNLCTLFELQSSSSSAKKAELLPDIVAVSTDSFDTKSLKLS